METAGHPSFLAESAGGSGPTISGDGSQAYKFSIEGFLAIVGEAERQRIQVLAGVVGLIQERVFLRDGAPSIRAWLKRMTGLGPNDASLLVRQANLLRHLPGLHQALLDGLTSLAHIEALARVATERRSSALADFAAQLIGFSINLGAGDFDELCRRWAALVDEHVGRGCLSAQRSAEGPEPTGSCRRTDLAVFQTTSTRCLRRSRQFVSGRAFFLRWARCVGSCDGPARQAGKAIQVHRRGACRPRHVRRACGMEAWRGVVVSGIVGFHHAGSGW